MATERNILPFDRVTPLSAFAANVTDPLVLSVLNASPDCIKIIELDGTLSFMNENGRCSMEIDDFDSIAGAHWRDLWPETSRPIIDDALDRARQGEAVRLESLCPTAKGTPRWWDVSVAPVRDLAGQIVRVVSISRDITDQVAREDRLREHDLELKKLAYQQAEDLKEKEQLLNAQSVLLREIDHRVKNSLAMISGLLRIQARTVDDERVEEALSSAAYRVLTVSKVHERLYHDKKIGSVRLDEYLAPLCADLHESMTNGNVTLATDIAPIEVSADEAVALGLITSEIVVNALRHGFGDDSSGALHVCATKSEDGQRQLSIGDTGTGLPEDFDIAQQGGLGMKILHLYSKQIGGTLTCTNNSGAGARFDLIF